MWMLTAVCASVASLLALLAVILDSIPLLMVSPVIAGICAAKQKLAGRVIAFLIYYVLWVVSMFIHTIFFKSKAIMGIFAAIFYFPIISVLYALASLLAYKIAAKG